MHAFSLRCHLPVIFATLAVLQLAQVSKGQAASTDVRVGDRVSNNIATVASDPESFGAMVQDGLAVKEGVVTYREGEVQKTLRILPPQLTVLVKMGVGQPAKLIGPIDLKKGGMKAIDFPSGAEPEFEFNSDSLELVREGGVYRLKWQADKAKLDSYEVQLNDVETQVILSLSPASPIAGQVATLGVSYQGVEQFAGIDGLKVTLSDGQKKSAVAFRLDDGPWAPSITFALSDVRSDDAPRIRVRFLSTDSPKILASITGLDKDLDAGALDVTVKQNSLAFELSAVSARVGDWVEPTRVTLASGSTARVEFDQSNRTWTERPGKQTITAKYNLFDGDPVEGNDESAFVPHTLTSEVHLEVAQALTMIQFKEGLAATAEPLVEKQLPITFRSADGSSATDEDWRRLSVHSDTPEIIDSVNIIKSGPEWFLVVLPLKRGSARLSFSYDTGKPELGQEYRGTLHVQVQVTVRAALLKGTFIPLGDELVSRLYGTQMAKAYHIIQCTLINDVKNSQGGNVEDIIVQPDSIEFGVVLQHRSGPKDIWHTADLGSHLAGALPGGILRQPQLTGASIASLDRITKAFARVRSLREAKCDPVLRDLVVFLLLDFVDQTQFDSEAHAASELNNALSGLASTETVWKRFAKEYGIAGGPSLEEKVRIIGRRLQLATDGGVFAGDIPFLIWKPLSPEAVKADFEVLARREPEMKFNKAAHLLLGLVTAFAGSTFLAEGERGVWNTSVAIASNGLMPVIQGAFPDMSETRRKTLSERLFAGPLRVSPLDPITKHIFVSKDVLRDVFGAKEVRVVQVVSGSLAATVAVVTRDQRTGGGGE